MSGARAPLRGLYAITDTGLCRRAGLAESVRLALEGGARIVQYRDKSDEVDRRRREAHAVAELCRQHAAVFIVNDDVELAAGIPGAGLHVGRDDLPLAAARDALGDDRIIGVSCYHRLDLALVAERQGADYVAFGRFFESTTKPGAAIATRGLLAEARRRLAVPIAAIGGIDAANAAALAAEGAAMLACIHGVFGQPDIRSAARAISAAFDAAITGD